MTWITDTRFLALAIETTGPDSPDLDRVLSVSLALVTPEHPDQPVRRTWLVDHGMQLRIPDAVTARHGIGVTQTTLFGHRPAHVLGDLTDMLEKLWRGRTPLVVFDAPYVFTVLDHEIGRTFPGQGLDLLQHGPVLDVLCLDRTSFPERHQEPVFELHDLATAHDVALADPHDVDQGVRALVRILRAQIASMPPLGVIDPTDLASSQVGWHRNYCRNTAYELDERRRRGDGNTFERVDWRKRSARLRISAYAWPMHTRNHDEHPVDA